MTIKMDIPQLTFLVKHGPKIGAALCSISAIMVMGLMLYMLIISLPRYAAESQAQSRKIVAENTGAVRP
jgi:hypothetical protein